MSRPGASSGLHLLRERAASIPAALREAAAAPLPDLGGWASGAIRVTGIGSSGAHARYLAYLLADACGLRARFAAPGEFVGAPPPQASDATLIVFSQGLSPNASFALAHARSFARTLLVTSTPRDGGARADAARKRALLHSLEDAGARVFVLPGADEYGTLLRVVGPMVGYLGALRIAAALSPHTPPFDADEIARAVATAEQRLGAPPPSADEDVALLALGATAELAGNLRLKLVEGLRLPAPGVWDLLQLAHGPWQALQPRSALLLALTHAGAAAERELVDEAEALLVPGRQRLVRLEASLPAPLGIFEHEALLNALVLRGIDALGIDPTRWPGSERESALYEMQPGAGAKGAGSPVSRARARDVAATPARSLPRALAALTWPEIEALLAAGCRTAVIPLGAIEQHGPHLPLDTDARIADALAERFCAAVPEALRLPALWPGCSREHLGFPGTLDLRASTLEALLVDVVGSLARHGFDHLFVFSAHGGNDAALRAMLPALRAASAPARVTAFTGVERIAAAQARASAAEGVAAGACGHHAGEHETSILLGLSPSAVRADRLELGVTEVGQDPQALFYPDLRQRAPNGVVGDPRQASGRRAEGYLAAWADALVAAYRAEKNAK